MGIFDIIKEKKDDGLTPEEREKISQYSACFAGPAGDYVVADLYLLTGLATSIFADVDYDPIKAAHRDGMQTLLKRILNYSGRTVYK
jgi:hypothetical protein